MTLTCKNCRGSLDYFRRCVRDCQPASVMAEAEIAARILAAHRKVNGYAMASNPFEPTTRQATEKEVMAEIVARQADAPSEAWGHGCPCQQWHGDVHLFSHHPDCDGTGQRKVGIDPAKLIWHERESWQSRYKQRYEARLAADLLPAGVSLAEMYPSGLYAERTLDGWKIH